MSYLVKLKCWDVILLPSTRSDPHQKVTLWIPLIYRTLFVPLVNVQNLKISNKRKNQTFGRDGSVMMASNRPRPWLFLSLHFSPLSNASCWCVGVEGEFHAWKQRDWRKRGKTNRVGGGAGVPRVFFESKLRYIPIGRPRFRGLFEDHNEERLRGTVCDIHWKL